MRRPWIRGARSSAREGVLEQYVERGERGFAEAHDYDSTTAKQLTLEETEELLLTIPQMQRLVAKAGAQ